MEKIDYSKLTLEQKQEIVKQGEKVQEGCSDVECGECAIHFENYINLPTSILSGKRKRLGCAEVLDFFKKDIEAPVGTAKSGETIFETGKLSADMEFTPENTSLEYLVDKNLLITFCKLFDDDAMQAICNKSGCQSCNLHQNNFSDDWKSPEGAICKSLLRDIYRFGQIYEKIIGIDKPSKPKPTQETCETCKYRTEVGEFTYCTAWKNFTTNDMHCGYYLTKDTENDIITE